MSELVRPHELQKLQGLAVGRIESFSGDTVTGWLYAPTENVLPMLYIDDKQAELVDWPMPRQDLLHTFRSEKAAAFEFRANGYREGARVQLFGLVQGKMRLITESVTPRARIERDFWRQLDRVRGTARREDAVAVTNWDGAHNPIGRAKVLYDVLAQSRPVTLFTYIMGDFGTNLWPPLLDDDINIVTIPWAERDAYHKILHHESIEFNTVWICKPRLPNFHLASSVAAENARIILDYDDNDDHFSSSKASQRKIYGSAGLGLSRELQRRVPTRTVASVSLQRDYGGQIVRHSRNPNDFFAGVSARHSDGIVRVGFIGTARPHKNLAAAARAVVRANWAISETVEFHVYGDIKPEALRNELNELGVVTRGMISARELPNALAGLDVILAGFPVKGESHYEASKYQITAKIGDALASGKPVLVPRSPSVEDLDDVDGIYIFDEEDFGVQLTKAIRRESAPFLPDQFTLTGALESFDRAECDAEEAPRASEVFSILREAIRDDRSVSRASSKYLLLWKQNDAGLYGRRVDQVARALKADQPESDVVVLELLHDVDRKTLDERSVDMLSDASLIANLASVKAATGYRDEYGVRYDLIAFPARAKIADRLFSYLAENSFTPNDTTVITFPQLRYYDDMVRVLHPYRRVVDVVDNHFAWANGKSERELTLAKHYAELFFDAAAIVFNSSTNREYFEALGVLPAGSLVETIPNWYFSSRVPEIRERRSRQGMLSVVYSGNMNDRVDWDAMTAIVESRSDVRLHLIGAAQRATDGFFELLLHDRVQYHGPLSENATLAVLSDADVAVMPHVRNLVSEFMNPLKIHMYRSQDIPVVATDVLGVATGDQRVRVAHDRAEFLELLWEIAEERQAGRDSSFVRRDGHTLPSDAQSYLELLRRLSSDRIEDSADVYLDR